MKNHFFALLLAVFLIKNIVYSQGIAITSPLVKPGSYKKIVVDTFGIFNPDNRFVLKIKSIVTFSYDSLPGSPRYTNEFVNDFFLIAPITWHFVTRLLTRNYFR
ncbi:hypothetical protein [Emticicia sp. BO119]|uniref:hypothetical protein n=1 Tax=Emticicia sp. BO119 TaxID=2757768 RepID=UPI0015F03A84|nr:hypothetical protein [Emticicia sp. BO119]MBA4850492.1 hypothetical protein [Emticicia sp. BO119]